MKKIDVASMSTDDLWSLHEKITEILSARITAEKRGLEERLAALGRGHTIEGGTARATEGKARRKYPRVFPKYRNPSVPSETWSGRGKQPRWLAAALKSGHKIDDFKIKDFAGSKAGLRRA